MHDEGFAKRLDEITDLLGGIGKACTAADISYPTLGRWKAGTSEPLAVNLAKLARQANVSMDWLIYGEGDGVDTKREQQVITSGDDKYEYVPFYKAEASAGQGSFLDEQREPTHHLAFRKRWLTAKGFTLKDMVGLIARGDSMEPTIQNGAAIIINTSRSEAMDGGIFVVRIGDRLWVKRTQWLTDGGLRLISDNHIYEKMDVTPTDLAGEDIEVIGQVVHTAYDLVR